MTYGVYKWNDWELLNPFIIRVCFKINPAKENIWYNILRIIYLKSLPTVSRFMIKENKIGFMPYLRIAFWWLCLRLIRGNNLLSVFGGAITHCFVLRPSSAAKTALTKRGLCPIADRNIFCGQELSLDCKWRWKRFTSYYFIVSTKNALARSNCKVWFSILNLKWPRRPICRKAFSTNE